MTMTIDQATGTGPREPVSFLELEITRACTLKCRHCYSNSGPAAGHGTMTPADWMDVIEQAAAHPTIDTVQFIGGEPTLHPTFGDLVQFALLSGLKVAVFTNLIEVTPKLWELYEHDGVRLSTSWYSADPAEHDQIVGEPGAHNATWTNLLEVTRRRIPVKVAIVRILDDQDVTGAVTQINGLGITHYNVEDARAVGRALAPGQKTTEADLCGMCGDGRAAIDTSGRLTPCVLGRHLEAGNVRDTPLADMIAGDRWADMIAGIPRSGQMCPPGDSNDCGPAV
ncbi:radical SAM/SPASM domain-containing protein [Spirillospora sp. NPDC127200]